MTRQKQIWSHDHRNVINRHLVLRLMFNQLVQEPQEQLREESSSRERERERERFSLLSQVSVLEASLCGSREGEEREDSTLRFSSPYPKHLTANERKCKCITQTRQAFHTIDSGKQVKILVGEQRIRKIPKRREYWVPTWKRRQ